MAGSGLSGAAGRLAAPLGGRHCRLEEVDPGLSCAAVPESPGAEMDGPLRWLHLEGAFVCTDAAASSDMRLSSG